MTYQEKIAFILSKECSLGERKLIANSVLFINDEAKFEKFKSAIDMLYEQKQE